MSVRAPRPPTRAQIRRRRAAVLGAAALALAAGVAAGARGGREPARAPRPVAAPAPARERSARAAVDRLSLRQQVGRLVVLRFEGTEAPAYVLDVLRRGWAAGVILFPPQAVTRRQLRALTRAVHAAGRRGGATPIVCADQEGGAVRVLTWAPPAAPAAAQNPGPDARAAGAALRADGVNVSLAPVADVPRVPGAALAGRAFSRDPAAVSAAVAAAVRGWRAGGVAPAVKHFPGLGAATVNTDDEPVTIAGAPTGADLAPFGAAVAAGVPLVMTSHARYPALDAQRIASQSPAVVRLLRERLGFRGVIVTDSIEAAAVRAVATPEQAALRAIGAGGDLVLTTGQGSWIRVYRALLDEARASSAFRARVRASAARVLALQQTLR